MSNDTTLRTVATDSLEENETHETHEAHGAHGAPGATGEHRQPDSESWSSDQRCLAGVAGFVLMDLCWRRRTTLWTLLGAAGFGLTLRAITNHPITRTLGFDMEHRDARAKHGSSLAGAEAKT